MRELFTIAWRNCWRNGLRSLIIICAIILGICSSVFLMGFMNGFINQRVDKMVSLQLGDIQIHAVSYDYDNDVTNTIHSSDKIEKTIQNTEGVVSYSSRFKTDAYVVSPHGQRGVTLLGVDPENEIQTLALSSRMVSGTFLDSDLAYPVLVGHKLAEKLKLRLNSKLQISLTNTDATQVAKNFKVCGIFRAGDDSFDGFTVFVPKDRIQKLLGKSLTHEIIIKAESEDTAIEIVNKLSASFPKNSTEFWKKRYPEISYGIDMVDSMMYFLMTIIIGALLFGIVNTLTMSIMERKREIGVMLAIGMSKWRIRLMIVFESLIYGLVGGPIGILLGYLVILYFGYYGLDLSSFSEGMEAFGFDPLLYFSIESKYYFIYTGYILVATFIGGFYPSRLATRLNPIEAIRSV